MNTIGNLTSIYHRATKEKIPLTVMFELTNHCNFRCQHCYIPSYESPDQLPTSRIFEVFEELAGMGTLYIGLTGGEALLRPDWDVVARRARDLGFFVTLLTNGSLIDEAKADVIADLDLIVHISFFSGEEDVFNTVTTKNNSYEKVIRGIELLCERDVNVELKVPLMKLNADGLASVREIADRYDIHFSAFPRTHSKTNGNQGPIQLRLNNADVEKFYLTEQPGRVTAEQLCTSKVVDEDGSLCAAGSRLAVVHANGDVSACIIMPGKAGSLRESSFREIWTDSPFLHRLRNIRWTDVDGCSDCSKKAYCGRCPAQALLEDGSILGPSTEACSHAEIIERAAKKGA